MLKWSEVAQSCLTLCNSVDCSLPASSIHRILQARILEWVAISFSRDLPDQGSNLGLQHYRQTLYRLSHQGSPTDMLNADHSEVQGNVWCASLLTSKCCINPHFLLKFWNLKLQRAKIQVSSPHQPQIGVHLTWEGEKWKGKRMPSASNIKISAKLCLISLQPPLVSSTFFKLSK